MALYIHGMSAISPQQTWGASSLPESFGVADESRFRAIEPDYSEHIDPKLLRRMSRIIRMGIASSKAALAQAGVSVPDAIITGTGYGCLDDTGIFLTKMIENKEEALNPTPFIQSTHNTIGSQVALLLQCQGYNQTYAHGAFSFESALIDALMQTEDDPAKNILVGGVDEITDISHAIQSRFRLFGMNSDDGPINGEGSIFFSVSGERNPNSIARIDTVATWFKKNAADLQKSFQKLVDAAQPDLIIGGQSGNPRFDTILDRFIGSGFHSIPAIKFKQLCGEFPVASAFATWLAAGIIRDGRIPQGFGQSSVSKPGCILILNEYLGTHHSAIILRESNRK